MENNVKRFPISRDQRKRNELGFTYLPCEVSPRWLQVNFVDKELGLVAVDVMTKNEEDLLKKENFAN